jgi:uncharacterized protein YutE (UPF0331/DUF86 family)
MITDPDILFDDRFLAQQVASPELVLDKAASIGRCVARIREEYAKDPLTFAADTFRQDAAICNLQRACQACIDTGLLLVRKQRLDAQQSGSDVFEILAQAGEIDSGLAERLQRLIRFHYVAVYNYEVMEILDLVQVIETQLDNL